MSLGCASIATMPKRPPRIAQELPVPADLRGRADASGAPHKAYETELGTLWLSDALALLATIEDEAVNLVVTDPPYAIAKEEWDLFESSEAYIDWCDQWLAEVERVLVPEGSAYVCGFSETLADIKARSARRFAGGCRWLIWHYRNKANLGSDWGRSHARIDPSPAQGSRRREAEHRRDPRALQ
jgi:site-specific DNA-methyltransferase (adenine-specific)